MAPDRRSGRRSGSRGRLVAGGALVVLLAGVPVASVPAARAAEASLTADLQVAQIALERGLQQLERGYKTGSAAQVEAASDNLARSRDRLQAVARRVRPLDAARGAAVPGVVRGRVTTLDAVIDMATHLDVAGTTGAEALLQSGLVGGTQAGAPIGTTQLTDLLAVIRDQLAQADRSAAGVDVTVLPAGQRATLTKAPAGGHAVRTTTDLAQDRLLTLRPDAVVASPAS